MLANRVPACPANPSTPGEKARKELARMVQHVNVGGHIECQVDPLHSCLYEEQHHNALALCLPACKQKDDYYLHAVPACSISALCMTHTAQMLCTNTVVHVAYSDFHICCTSRDFTDTQNKPFWKGKQTLRKPSLRRKRFKCYYMQKSRTDHTLFCLWACRSRQAYTAIMDVIKAQHTLPTDMFHR